VSVTISDRIDRCRRELARWVLGKRSAIFLPSEYRETNEGGYYEHLPDHELAQVARYFFYVSRNVNREMASEQGVPASVFTMSQAVMSVIRFAIEANAETATFTQSGEISGQPIGVWRVEARRMPNDYDFGPGGVEETYSEDDPSKLVRLDVGYRLPLPSKTASRPAQASEG